MCLQQRIKNKIILSLQKRDQYGDIHQIKSSVKSRNIVHFCDTYRIDSRVQIPLDLNKNKGQPKLLYQNKCNFFSKTDKHIKLISIHTYQLTCSFSGNSKNPKSFPLMNYKTSHQNYAHGYIPICNILKIINTISSQTFNHKILVNSKYANEPSRNSQAILVTLTTIEEPEEL